MNDKRKRLKLKNAFSCTDRNACWDCLLYMKYINYMCKQKGISTSFLLSDEEKPHTGIKSRSIFANNEMVAIREMVRTEVKAAVKETIGMVLNKRRNKSPALDFKVSEEGRVDVLQNITIRKRIMSGSTKSRRAVNESCSAEHSEFNHKSDCRENSLMNKCCRARNNFNSYSNDNSFKSNFFRNAEFKALNRIRIVPPNASRSIRKFHKSYNHGHLQSNKSYSIKSAQYRNGDVQSNEFKSNKNAQSNKPYNHGNVQSNKFNNNENSHSENSNTVADLNHKDQLSQFNTTTVSLSCRDKVTSWIKHGFPYIHDLSIDEHVVTSKSDLSSWFYDIQLSPIKK